ncbi:MAG: hypothetical protein AB1801_09145 [Chloroflexota bacterium]
MSDFKLIRHELARLESLPPWGRPQGDHWDRLSGFIYRVQTWPGVLRQTQAVASAERLDQAAFTAYAVRRWFNHHTHDQILQMFYAHPDVTPEQDRRHHSIDFYLREIPFDLKISRFPRAYPETIDFARQNPHHLALWQYEHQSRQGRYHTGNRLFIILHHAANPELTWQLRRDFEALESLIQNFLTAPILLGLNLAHHRPGESYRPWTAVIFYIKSNYSPPSP